MTTGNASYNGWTNYATWRINLELFSDSDWTGVTADTDVAELVEELKASLEMYIDESVDWSCSPYVRGWVNAFVSDVNFHEIAEHIIVSEVNERD